MTGAPRRFPRGAGVVRATLFGLIVDATSLLPPRLRYAYVHRITARLFRRPLPALLARDTPAASGPAAVTSPRPADLRCVLAADRLDIGGVGAVVEMLATGLEAQGVHPIVVCLGDGTRARRLRARGVEVFSVEDERTALAALRAADPDVIQLHSAAPALERLAIAGETPLIPVLHNTEIHFTRVRWRAFETLMHRSYAAIAVSGVVRDFHRRHVSPALGERFRVVPNEAPGRNATGHPQRTAARAELGDVLGVDLAADVVFLCLARYDAQKNIAGTVASFLRAIDATGVPIRLVMAGEPSDWAELGRADGIRRSSPHGDRVHLLANSDAATLLAAADAFLLNSFFEGWPVAATEALSAGLPLVLSDVGGARELVARHPDRSVLIPNATGEAGSVTDARVARARRRSARQDNAADLIAAVTRVAQLARSDGASRADPAPAAGSGAGPSGIAAMMAGHAQIIREAHAHARGRRNLIGHDGLTIPGARS